MPKRTDIRKIMLLGSGPVVVGQAAEFDYAGTQACAALRERGFEVVLVNPNPAAVMTDVTVADKVYMEPLTLEYVARVMRRERPDAVLANMGGQTALNLALQLDRKGILRECRSELLGLSADSIEKTGNRECFKRLCTDAREPSLPFSFAASVGECLAAAEKIGYPVMLRPAQANGGDAVFAETPEALPVAAETALTAAGRVLVERSVRGWKELELEVLRDAADNVVCVCGLENVDPVGIHSGDSVIVAPCQTVSGAVLSKLWDSAEKLIRALGIRGVCSVRFALSPASEEYCVLAAAPRFTRTSALAAKATGYPLAQVIAKVAVGLTLDEILLGNRTAHFDPAPDYIVTRLPRFPFDRFTEASNRLGTQMKATGAVMAIGKTLTESLMKAVRSLEAGICHVYLPKFDGMSKKSLLAYVGRGTDDRLHAVAQLYRLGAETGEISAATGIDPVFLEALGAVAALEPVLAAEPFDIALLERAKKLGFSDRYIARLWNVGERAVWDFRLRNRIAPEYLMVDTCARDAWSYVPCFYSSYNGTGRHGVSSRKKIVVLGSGPIRIGQGVEFDYSAVHAAQAFKNSGYEAIIVNNNPETVSTDPAAGDRLYLEPLTAECVMDIAERERPLGVVAAMGGQTAAGLAFELEARGVRLIGTGVTAMALAEDPDSFEKLLLTLLIPQPGADGPARIDKYISGREVEADAVCDGTDVFIPGIMEHVERTGVHSGDSIGIYPTFSISEKAKGKILAYTKKLGLGIGIVGLYNVRFLVDRNDTVYVTQVSPRASRTVPFLSRATGWPIADIAAFAMLGRSLREQGIFTLYPEEKKKFYVKVPVFSFSKLQGLDACLSPEMKSTGETMGCDRQLTRALYKALQASGLHVQNYGTVFATIADADKDEALPLIRRFYDLGFNIEATSGTAAYLKDNGIRTHVSGKLSEGSGEILDSIRSGHVTYVINTRDPDSLSGETDGMRIRRCATENNVAIFTSLDTVRVLLDVLEEMTICVETIDA